MVYIYYWLLFFKKKNLKSTSTRKSFNSLWLYYNFLSLIVFYLLFMYSIVLEICIGGCLLEDCFCCYSQQITSAIANKSLISYNLIKRAPETQNQIPPFFSIWIFFHKHSWFTYLFNPSLLLPPTSQTLDISWAITADSSTLHIAHFEQNILFHTNINNKKCVK